MVHIQSQCLVKVGVQVRVKVRVREGYYAKVHITMVTTMFKMPL